MTDDSARTFSRRRLLGTTVGTVATVGTAGCLGSLLSSTSSNQIDPEDPSGSPDGTPGEFYHFLEDHDIEVDELARENDELYLTYRSNATDVEGSNEEITVIYEIYKQALIYRGSDIEFLYTEISNPFDDQAHGWGIDTEWVHQFDSEADGDDVDDVETPNETTGNETTGNESNGESADALDMAQITLWNNIMNSKVYGADGQPDGNAGIPGDGNETINDSSADNSTTEPVDTESDN